MSKAPRKSSVPEAALLLGTPPPAGTRLSVFLNNFRHAAGITTKGKLSQMVYLSRVARTHPLPLNIDEWLTEGQGQIKGASGAAVKKVLAEYGITRTLSSEGGRTSRGSLGYVETYIRQLNALHAAGDADAAAIEAWWVARVQDFFNATPFSLRYDPGKNLRSVVRSLMDQAAKRQRSMGGMQVVGILMQHLVGAKLELCLPAAKVKHHNASSADESGARSGDFLIENTVIHVTTAPGEPLMNKCAENLRTGELHPVIITTPDRIAAADQVAQMVGIRDNVEIWDVEQFIATNLLELGGFSGAGRRVKLTELVNTYNSIIERTAEDPSFRIEI